MYLGPPHECRGLVWRCALSFSFNRTQRLLSNVHMSTEPMFLVECRVYLHMILVKKNELPKVTLLV